MEGQKEKHSFSTVEKFDIFKLILYILLFLCFILLLYRYFYMQKEIMTAEVQNNLKSIGTLKSQQIENWRIGRIKDAITITSNRTTKNKIISVQNSSSYYNEISELKQWFTQLNDEFKSVSIKLLDKNGKFILAVPHNNSYVDKVEKDNISEVIRTKKIYFSDFHFQDSGNYIHLDIIIPVISDRDSSVERVIIIERDPNVFIYPLLNDWPYQQKTLETLLVEDDGNGNVVYLNELKYKDNAALNFKISKDNADVLAVKAINHITGLVEGRDYRGSDVLGFISPIKDTKWFMVVRIDKDEIYDDINKLTIQFSAVMGLLLFISFIMVYLRFRTYRQRSQYFVKMYELESEKKSLAENYVYVLKNANDAILIFDLEGNFFDSNEKATELYGYTKEEFLKLNIRNVRTPDEVKKLDNQIEKIRKQNGDIYETINVKKDGTIFPVEISARFVQINNKQYVQGIIRDITERKRYENELRASEEKYRGLFENMIEGLAYCKMTYENGEPVDWIFLDVNDSFTVLTGLKDVKGRYVSEVSPELKKTNPEIYDLFSHVATTGKPEKFEVYVIPLEKWLLISVYSNEKEYFVIVFDNITERINAELQLEEKEKHLRNLFENMVEGYQYNKLIYEEGEVVDYEILEVNKAYYKLTGFNDVIGKRVSEVVPDLRKNESKLLEIYARVSGTGKPERFEYKSDSMNKWLSITAYSYEKEHIIILFDDITKRKKAEEELRESKAKLDAALDSMTDAVYITDIEGKFIEFNEAMATFYKFRSKSECVKTFAEYPDFIEAFFTDGTLVPVDMWSTPRALRGEIETNVEYILHRKDIGQIWVGSYSFAPIRNDKGEIVGSVVVSRDITDQKRAQEALKKSEERLKLALNATDTGVFELELPTNSIYCSPECLELFGYKKNDFNLNEFRKILFPPDAEIFEKLMDNISKNLQDSFAVELRIVKSVGGVIWLSFNGKTEYDNSYKPIKIIGTFQDITERKRNEERNVELTRVYSMLSSINSSIVWIKDKNKLMNESCRIAVEQGNFKIAWIGMFDETLRKINPVAYAGDFEKVFGKEEMTTLCDCISIRDALYSFESNEFYISNDYDKDFEDCTYKNKFKEFGYKSIAIFPIKIKEKVVGVFEMISDKRYFFNDKEITLLNEIVTDISYGLTNIETESEKHYALNQLKISEYKFKMIFEKASDAIMLMERDIIKDCNSMVSEISGYEKDEILGKSVLDFLPVRQKDGRNSYDIVRKIIDSALKGNTTLENIEILKKDGGLSVIEVSLSSIQIDERTMLIAIFRDVTEFLQYQESLKAAKERAEEMNKLKSNFLANMSHELRTPMTGILGFADVLSSSLENPELKEMADVILKSGKRLTDTLNLILDLSRIEADKIDLKMKNTNLSEISRDTAKIFEILAKEKNLFIRTNIEEDVYALLDDQLIEKIINNLVKNAIIYTKKGNVTVETKHTIENGKEYSVLRVTDTGIGIPQNQLQRIFEPFRQVSEGFSRDFEGTGLGLTITKKYVEIMNGTITVNSTLNQGSEFIVKFPSTTQKKLNITKLKSTIEEKKIPEKVKGAKLLIVEDDDNSKFALEYTLKNLCELDFTNNGEEAIRMAAAKKYNMIIMDMGLKGISGLDATKEIRKLEGYENTPIIAVTAFAMIGDREKIINGGCTYYITKPFNFAELKRQVIEVMKSQ